MDKINGKTPEEIERALQCCANGCAPKAACAYNRRVQCLDDLLSDLVPYIWQVKSNIPRWVSVADAVPGETGSYIVCTDRGAVCTARFYAEGGIFAGVAGRHVTHWMPLPEPPGGE